MPPRVTLTAISGQLDGRSYSFSERTTCLIGRSKDCLIKIPSNKTNIVVSRHHCLLDINPPEIRVRDFGSLNGTFVNDELIGRRHKDETPEEGQQMDFAEKDLAHGDTLRVQNTEFQLSVELPCFCEECGHEIAAEDQETSRTGNDVFVCFSCRTEALATQAFIPHERRTIACAECGRDVAAEMGPHRDDQYVCSACKADPFKVMKKLLGDAKSGQRDLAAIRGYEIIRSLGKGGMGAVYLARNESTGDLSALKIMLPKAAASPRCREMFMREAENTKSLEHPNIVKFFDAGYSQGTFFFTMEYCEEGGVDKFIRTRGKPLSVEEATSIMLPFLDGLDYAHRAAIPHVKLESGGVGTGTGLVHRDISPHNILLTRRSGKFVPKISDFGLSKAFDLAGLSGLTCSGGAAGKPFFMCRQQLIDYKFAKPEVDVWAAAATLYSLLTGFPPRQFSKDKDVWKTVLQDAPISILKRNPNLPPRLAQVLDQALNDRHELPFKSAKQLKMALEKAL